MMWECRGKTVVDENVANENVVDEIVVEKNSPEIFLPNAAKIDHHEMSLRFMKFGLLLCVGLISSCSTAPSQTKYAMSSPQPVVTAESVAKTSAEKTDTSVMTGQSTAAAKSSQAVNSTIPPPQSGNSPTVVKTYPGMSEATRKRLKNQARSLMTNGTVPRLKYVSPDSPGLKMLPGTNQQASGSATIQLDYEQVEIRQILEEFADAMEMTIVIDPSVSGKVTMRTAPSKALSQDDLWPLLQMLLTEAGVALEKRNGIYYAHRAQQYLPSVIGYSSMLDATGASVVMQITPLKYISVESAITVLKPIVEPKGRITQLSSLNTLLIVDNPEKLKRINGLLSLVDSDPFKSRGIHLYKLHQAEAKKIVKELDDILKLIEGNKPSYQVLALERINALLVVAPPGRGFREVSRWVDILDAGADEELVEQIFIYKCKSMKAASLASTLNAIFQQDDKDKRKDKKTEEEDLSPNTFRTVSKESLSFKEAVKRGRPENKVTTAPVKEKKHDTTEEVASADINVTIVADEDTNSLLVRTTAKDYQQLLETIRIMDMVPLQVLINVVIAQVALTDGQSFGIDWSYRGSTRSTYQTNFGQAQSVSDSGEPLGLLINRLTSNWRVTLNALAQEGSVNILSRPSLLITNNQEGVINVGKEVPVETSNTSNLNSTDIIGGTNVTQQIAYRKTGIELTVTPQINDDGIVNMIIKQSLSAIEGQTTNTDASSLNPTFTNQEIQTTVIVRDNETIVLGGLIDTFEVSSEAGVPWLKDIPLMGNLFKSQGKQVERRELILIISTQILDAEGDYSDFNNSFKNRFHAAATFLDQQLETPWRTR
jgi:general secretion pathway protein D